MKLRCNRQQLTVAVSGVSRAVSPKSHIPALEGILFQAKDQEVVLTGYDMDTGITTTVAAEVEKQGEIVIPSRLLFDILRKVSSDDVSIESDEKGVVTLVSGISVFTFSGISASDFPEMPSPETETALCIAGDVLKGMVERTLFAVAQDNQKPVHTGTKFIVTKEDLTLVSVDGYRLAVAKKAVEGKKEQQFVVPAKTLSEISRLIDLSEEEVYIGTARRYAIFSLKDYTVITRLLEGDFLDYARAIPSGHKTRVVAPVSALYQSVDRASLIINERIKNPVRLNFADGTIAVQCQTSIGRVYDEIDCDIEGEDIEIGFNNRYVLDALRNCGEETVVLELNDPISPMKILPVEGDAFLFLVLPVRIRAEL